MWLRRAGLVEALRKSCAPIEPDSADPDISTQIGIAFFVSEIKLSIVSNATEQNTMSKQAQLKIVNTALIAISDRIMTEGLTAELEQALAFWTAKQMCALFAR